MSGVAETEKGTLAGVYAAPLGMGTSQTTGTTYMSVEGGGTEMATFSTPQTSLASIGARSMANPSNMNSFAISMGAFTLTGTELATMLERPATEPSRSSGNQLVTITGLGAFHDGDVLLDRQCVRVQPCKRSGAVDLGDDDDRVCRTWLRGVPPELEGSSARHLIRLVSKHLRRVAARRPSFLRRRLGLTL